MDINDLLQPFEFSVQVSIDGRILDYLLSVDATGHVHRAEPLVFELPAITQKLILGESDGQLERKIKAYARLFRYLVPLVLAGKLPNYQEQLATLVDEINQRLSKKGILWSNLPDNLPSTLAFNLRKFYTTQKQVDPDAKSTFESIEYIINNLKNESDKLEDKLKNFITLPNSIAADFFSAVLPFLDFYTQTKIFRGFAYMKSEKVKNYLLEEINVPSCEPYSGSILHALKVYGAEDSNIFDAVAGFYERLDKQQISGITLINTLDVLRHYLRPRTKEIALEILRSNHQAGAYYAAEVLLNIGTTQKEIAREIMASFQTTNPDVSKVVFRIFEECLSEEYLPSADEILSVFVQTIVKAPDSDIYKNMAGIAIKTGIYLQPDKLIELFYHESAAVRSGVLHLINDFYEKLQRNFKPFKTERMLICYRDLSKTSEVEVAVQAIRLLGKAGHKKDVDFLLERISIDFQNHPIDEEAIKAINLIIQRIPYPFQIEPRYLAALANNRYTLKVAALKGLRYSPRTNFKKALADQYINDIHPVSEAAKELLSVPSRSIGIRLQEIAQKWGLL